MTNIILDNKKTQQCHKDGQNRWFSKIQEQQVGEEKIRDDLVQKSFYCKRQRTLCWALNELAQFENKKGTEAFCDYVIKVNLNDYYVPIPEIQHHPITGGGNPNDKTIENTEFIAFSFPELKRGFGWSISPPELPVYIDIQYLELAYAINKKSFHIAQPAYFGWNALIKTPAKWLGKGGNAFGHPPNKYGYLLGAAIANENQNLQDFINEWCLGESCKL